MLKKRSISRLVESCTNLAEIIYIYLYIYVGVCVCIFGSHHICLKVFILPNHQQLLRDKSNVEIAQIPIYPKVASLERCSPRTCCILSSWWISHFWWLKNSLAVMIHSVLEWFHAYWDIVGSCPWNVPLKYMHTRRVIFIKFIMEDR